MLTRGPIPIVEKDGKLELPFTKTTFIRNNDNEHGRESPKSTLQIIPKSTRSKGLNGKPHTHKLYVQ